MTGNGERPPAESSVGSLALVATAARILRGATLGRGKDRAPERGRGSQSGGAGPGAAGVLAGAEAPPGATARGGEGRRSTES
jgi:hypothetical protein